ncbi:HAD family phosphatase [Candidatus Bipolaricaulota bacterium]|nr:HAD family phosphatase [Candidatus Bipolaricaulota bacterium]
MVKTNKLYPAFQNIKAVHFDLDGSLVDSAQAWFESEIELLREYGVELSVEQIRDITHDELVGRGQWFAARFYKEKFGLSASVGEIRSRRIGMVKKYYGDMELIEGAESFLKTIAQSSLKVTLATSSPLELTDIFIRKHGFGELFDGVVSADQVEESKPSPDIFLKAAETVGVRPEDCLIVEDSKNGLLAAMEAGSLCLLIPNEKFSTDKAGLLEKADFVVESMEAIDLDKLREYLPQLKV